MRPDSLHPDHILRELAHDLLGPNGIDACGIALLEPELPTFETIAFMDRRSARRAGARQTVARPIDGVGRSFRKTGTVGEWVLSTKRPHIAEHVGQLSAFPQTADDQVRRGFTSNYVAPLELRGGFQGVVFFMDERRGVFSPRRLETLAGYQELLESATNTWLLARHLKGPKGAATAARPDADADADESATQPADPRRNGDQRHVRNPCMMPSHSPSSTDLGVTSNPSSSASPLTLDEVQRRHIEQTLRATDGVIEGPRGAAHALGMKPSTLRSRMRKLGAVNPVRPPAPAG